MTSAALAQEAMMVLDSMHQHIALLDAEGTVLAVNRAWQFFGIDNGATPQQAGAVGSNYLRACEPRDGAPADPLAAKARAGVAAVLAGQLPRFELQYPCDGPEGPLWFLMRVSPLVGSRPGAVVSHEDITERWQIERHRSALLDELLDFKAALDAHAIVAITDGHGRITYVNDKFCAISKWSREELLGRDHRIVSSGHHAKAFIANLWATIQAGKVWKGEIKNLAKDGSPYWVDTTIVPLVGRDGIPYQYIAIRAEITEQKLLEERNQGVLNELLTANTELSAFAHVVSHDLKAPLRGISSLATWLAEDHAEQLDATGRQHVALIGSRVKRLSGLIDAILTYSRAGRLRETPVAVPVDALVRNTIDLLAPPPHIRVRLDSVLPLMHIEAVKLQQVFQNLLGNAIDFMDKPVGVVSVRCVREGGDWHFSVADNGPGIEARHFERIFQLFQTLAPRDQLERTGVGLALVKKIVETEGGRVWVESTPGVGSTFHFTLPARQAGVPLEAAA